MKWLSKVLSLAGLLAALAPGAVVGAAPSPAKPVPVFQKDIAPLLARYCLKCHSGPRPRARFGLDRFRDDATARKDMLVWEKVADILRAGDMPPAGKPRPSAAEMATLDRWLNSVVTNTDCKGPPNPGRVTLRRLNRAEYNNTIRDLLGVDFQPARDFPADDVGYGFDNIGDVLSMPPLLMEKYLAAAETIVARVFKTPDARKRLLFRKVGDAESARQVLRRFVTRAYRRPLREPELDRLLRLVESARKNGESYEDGIQLAVQAVLVSPHFLFRVEMDPRGRSSVRQLNDFELASRLSYFLWCSMPDDELFGLASDARLHQPEVLEKQVRRMLRDPKARALTDNFASQWLNLRNLKGFAPDPQRFPTFDDGLRSAMLRETESFFEYVVREDRSILEFIDSDYTFLNERLARHYSIPGIKGEQFRRVSLTGTARQQRGGLLTQASILAVTSNPTRTSPVKRGKWILDNILGTPPPPPPPGVEELKEGKQVELKGSLRQRMEQHRTNPSCAVCHQRMDPLGFGFENFDAIGAWRTHEGKHPIDPSGTMAGDKSFKGPAELRILLLGRQEAFARCLTEKLLTYALGRGIERSDRCVLDELTRSLAKNQYHFSSLVLGIVKSDPFQKRSRQRGKR